MRKVIPLHSNNRLSVKNIIIISFTTLFFWFSSFNTVGEFKYKYRVKTVVIDAGHGGKDPGTSGDKAYEKDIALKIAIELGETIEKYLPDVKVIYTRKTDEFVELDKRAEIANKSNADLFISIHANSSPHSNNVKGAETWVMGLHTSDKNLDVAKKENSVIMLEENYEERYEGFDPESPESHILFTLFQNAYLDNSLNLARKLDYQFKHRVGRVSRGVKQAGFWVLWRTSMPSVLIETGFLSNSEEERYLMSDLGQTYIASGIFRAFRDYKQEIESMDQE